MPPHLELLVDFLQEVLHLHHHHLHHLVVLQEEVEPAVAVLD